MKKTFLSLSLVVVVTLAGCLNFSVPSSTKVKSPENASYMIEKMPVRLVDGRSEEEILPGSSSKIVTTLYSQTAFGDLDQDDVADAALLLVQQGGGSGSFFYAASALNVEGSYQGTNAPFLGDRISPLSIAIRDGLVVILYNDRRPDEPMAATPTVTKAKYFRIEAGQLKEVPHTGEDGSSAEQGWVTIGHEVHAFQSCEETEPRWLLGSSPALPEINTAHSHDLYLMPPYFPLFMTLSGRPASRPIDGFGHDYGAAFRADKLVEADPRGYCRNELIEVESPLPGAGVTTLLTVTGKARGSWFFEGDFPLILTDEMGDVIAKSFATAKGAWMTRDWVPFSGTLQLQKRNPGWGWLILKKDNPSERPDLDAEISIPVLLK